MTQLKDCDYFQKYHSFKSILLQPYIKFCVQGNIILNIASM